MLNWNEIADRFFSLYSEKQQSEIAKLFQVKQVSVSRWKNYIEKVPMRVFEQVVDSEGITWDWLLEGLEPKYRREVDGNTQNDSHRTGKRTGRKQATALKGNENTSSHKGN